MWWDSRPDEQGHAVIVVQEAAVALPTMTAADAVFAKFTEQWRHCVGASVIFARSVNDDISDVRAIGVRVNCLSRLQSTSTTTGRPRCRAGTAKALLMSRG